MKIAFYRLENRDASRVFWNFTMAQAIACLARASVTLAIPFPDTGKPKFNLRKSSATTAKLFADLEKSKSHLEKLFGNLAKSKSPLEKPVRNLAQSSSHCHRRGVSRKSEKPVLEFAKVRPPPPARGARHRKSPPFVMLCNPKH